MTEVKTFAVTVKVDHGEQLDCKHLCYCNSCGSELFIGDTIYKKRNGYVCCVDCFFESVANELLETAGA